MALDADHLVIITIHSWNEGAEEGKGKSKERFDVLVGRAAFRILIVRGARFFLRPIEFGHGLTQRDGALEKCNIR